MVIWLVTVRNFLLPSLFRFLVRGKALTEPLHLLHLHAGDHDLHPVWAAAP